MERPQVQRDRVDEEIPIAKGERDGWKEGILVRWEARPQRLHGQVRQTVHRQAAPEYDGEREHRQEEEQVEAEKAARGRAAFSLSPKFLAHQVNILLRTSWIGPARR
jgi:hypothetical protein